MIAFTLIGLLFFWLCCWHLGYAIAMFFDAEAKWDAFMKPYLSETEAFIAEIDVILKRRDA